MIITRRIDDDPFRITVISTSNIHISNMTKKEDINDKLVQWNDIFSDLTIDARDLIKDIKDMITYIAVLAFLMMAMGISAILIAVIRNQGPKYIAMGVIIFSVMAGNASLLIRKWHKLRIRYDKLNTIQDKLD